MPILILSPQRVATGLRTNAIGESTKARLVLLGYLFTIVVGGQPLAGYRTWGQLLITVTYIGAALGGFWSCFRANQEGDGRSFIERYICLSVPLTLWIYAVYTVISFVAFFVIRRSTEYNAISYTEAVQPYVTLLSFVGLAAYFGILRRLIRQVAGEAHAS